MAVMPLVEQAREANQAYADQYNVRLTIAQALPDAMIDGDSARLMQVLANLLSNAVKFSPRGGTVEMAVTRHDCFIRIAVIDHGSGIPEEFRSRIFQKFAQADSSDTRRKGGTGLGLSISKAIIERHGGQIGFETEPNVGTTFYIDLPERQASGAMQSAPDPIGASAGRT
jgi:signal transduction histidine kinase